jgi:hypothetical protein
MKYEAGVVAVVGVSAMAIWDFLVGRTEQEYKVDRVIRVHVEVISKKLGLSKKTVFKGLATLEDVRFIEVDSSEEDPKYVLSRWKPGEIGYYEDLFGKSFIQGIHYKLQVWADDNGFEGPDSIPNRIIIEKCREVLYPNG